MGKELLQRSLPRFERAVKVYFEEAEKFDAEAKNAWAKLPLRSPEEELREMECIVGDGQVKLMKVMRDGERVGIFGYAILDAEEGKTLYIAGISADSGDGISIWDISRCIATLAQEKGCELIRCETARSGMFRVAIATGFKPACIELVARTDDVVEKLKERASKNV